MSTAPIELPADPHAILQAANAGHMATLPRLYATWYTGERDVWYEQASTLLNLVDPIIRALCTEFGFRFSRQSLDLFLAPEGLFKLAFCSQQEMPDLYESEAMLRLRAKFAVLPSIGNARDVEHVLSDAERFLHPMPYVSMLAQFWLRDEACVIPAFDVELSSFLQAHDAC